MADDVDIRKARYKQMLTQELLELHAAGMLGNEAYDVLESELAGRGVTVPFRPNAETFPQVNEKTHSQLSKYGTFWRRVGAAILDFGALTPIFWIDQAIWNNVKVPVILAMWLIVSDFIGLVYEIAMHGLYGQTLGKFVFQIKVLDKSETPLRMRQAFYRDAVPILLFLPLSVYQIGNVMKGHIGDKGLQTFPHVWPFAIIGLSWLLLELLTMLTNKKRRAVHDFIAGSVVVTCLSEETRLARKVILSRRWLLVILGTMFVVTHGIAWFGR